jgi:deoxyadenosine/deoxycytidine kinase
MAYTFQSLVLLTRVQALEVIDPSCPIVFVERSVYSDRLFALNCYREGNMSAIEWKLYSESVTQVLETAALPRRTLHVYVRCAPEECQRRLRHRGREEERDIDLRYLQAIHAHHEECFDPCSASLDVVTVDGNLPRARLVQAVVAAVNQAPGSRQGPESGSDGMT